MDPAYPRTGKRLPAILGSAKKPGRLAAHDGLGDRVWLVLDDVHELAALADQQEQETAGQDCRVPVRML